MSVWVNVIWVARKTCINFKYLYYVHLMASGMMISAQLCFVLNAHFKMNDTIKISVYNTFCISTCLFIISLSTLIAPSVLSIQLRYDRFGFIYGLGWYSHLLSVSIHLSIFSTISMRFCHVLFILCFTDRSPAVDVERRSE